MSQSKTCTKCRQIKSLDSFSLARGNADGLQRECKDCNRAYRKANAQRRKEQHARWQRENKDKLHVTQKKWRDANPEKVKQYSQKSAERNPDYYKDYYRKNIDRRAIYELANKERLRANARQRYQENREEFRKKYKEWATAYPEKRKLKDYARRIRKANAKTYAITKSEILKLMTSNCTYCGNSGGQIDHIIPLARGGSHGIGNLTSACARCNQSKGAKTIMEWKKSKLSDKRKKSSDA